MPREYPPLNKDERIDWLVERHDGGREAECDWCLLVDTIRQLQMRANAAELKLYGGVGFSNTTKAR